MHAIVTNVELALGRDDEALAMLIESQAAAEAAVATRREGPAPGAPVSVISVRLMDVAASA